MLWGILYNIKVQEMKIGYSPTPIADYERRQEIKKTSVLLHLKTTSLLFQQSFYSKFMKEIIVSSSPRHLSTKNTKNSLRKTRIFSTRKHDVLLNYFVFPSRISDHIYNASRKQTISISFNLKVCLVATLKVMQIMKFRTFREFGRILIFCGSVLTN